MRSNEKLQEIFRKNAEFEKESPYNFCDRWCERCFHEKQGRCKLYQDEFEQTITCIAHGRDPGDPEIIEEVMKRQFEGAEDGLDRFLGEDTEESEIDLGNIDNPEVEEIKNHIEFVNNHPLPPTVEEYRKRAHSFLENAFYNKKDIKQDIVSDFETISWYHSLLPVKLHRALCGFHESASEGDLALYDAVAQLEICKKAIKESIKALRNIDKNISSCHKLTSTLLALLHNIYHRIGVMENSV